MSGNESDSVQLVEYRKSRDSRSPRARPPGRRGYSRPRRDVAAGILSDSEAVPRTFEYSNFEKGCLSEV